MGDRQHDLCLRAVAQAAVELAEASRQLRELERADAADGVEWRERRGKEGLRCFVVPQCLYPHAPPEAIQTCFGLSE